MLVSFFLNSRRSKLKSFFWTFYSTNLKQISHLNPPTVFFEIHRRIANSKQITSSFTLLHSRDFSYDQESGKSICFRGTCIGEKNLVYISYVSTVPSGHWTMFKLRIPGNTLASSATAFTLAVSPLSSMWKVKNLLGFLIQLCHLHAL